MPEITIIIDTDHDRRALLKTNELSQYADIRPFL